jgi:hypothetical protein
VAAAAAGGASPSAGFKRGLRRSDGGGVDCSSLMTREQKDFFVRRETKKLRSDRKFRRARRAGHRQGNQKDSLAV